MFYIGVTEGKIKNLKKEDKTRIIILIFIYTIHLAYLKVNTKLKTLATIGAKILQQKFSLERKKNEQREELICNIWLFFLTQYNS